MTEPLHIDTSPLMQNPNYRPVFFDFEVLKWECMLTVYDVWQDKWITARTPELCGNLLRGYLMDPRTVFAGFNNKNYDNLVATACIDNWSQRDIVDLNAGIIYFMPDTIHGVSYDDFSDLRFSLPNVWTFAKRSWDVGWDLDGPAKMGPLGCKIPYMSLKKWEKFNGYRVVETPIPFTHPLPLTEAEAYQMGEYNTYDVAATVAMGVKHAAEWVTRCGFADILGPKKFGWHKTFTKLSADLFVDKPKDRVGADDTLWTQTVPNIPDCLRIGKYTDILKHYSKRLWEIEERSLSVSVCGIPHTFGIGGGHSDSKRFVFKGLFWHVDASGFYPALMCTFDLCSRTMNKKKFDKTRRLRMSMAKSDPRRNVFKRALNVASGGMKDIFSTFYDPAKNCQVCILGQLFIVDLLDKLEPYTTLIQTNTDGVYVIPNSKEDAILAKHAIAEFQTRTKLPLDFDEYIEMYQRDVNNYITIERDGKETVKGSAFHSIEHMKPSVGQMMNRCDIMGTVFNPEQYTLEELAIVCTRDKNSRGFSIDGEETDVETIDVLPVFPFQSHEIHTVKKNGDFCKARLCPIFSGAVTQVSRAEIDYSYYQIGANKE